MAESTGQAGKSAVVRWQNTRVGWRLSRAAALLKRVARATFD
jgi:hypothetical protein